jgi:3-hydroxybutyryl-CoA dehydratase
VFGPLLVRKLRAGVSDVGQRPRGTIVIEDLEIGMMRHLLKEVTDRDIELFAEVSTDRNPVHLDDAYARDTIFEGRIAHGMLTAGLISAVIGEQLPGHGTVYLGQSLKFIAPVRPGDMVRAEVTVTAIDYARAGSRSRRVRGGASPCSRARRWSCARRQVRLTLARAPLPRLSRRGTMRTVRDYQYVRPEDRGAASRSAISTASTSATRR